MSMWRVLDRVSKGRFAIALGMFVTDWSSAVCLLVGGFMLLWWFADKGANINGVPLWIVAVPLLVLAVVFKGAYMMLESRPAPRRTTESPQEFPERDDGF